MVLDGVVEPLACKFLDCLISDGFESVGHHDVGYYVKGRCTLFNGDCRLLITDLMIGLRQSYDYGDCKLYRKAFRGGL